jgi:phenylacetate-CoA ligase
MPVQTARLDELQRQVETRLKEALITRCSVKLMKPHSIERSQGKAVRVVDKRQLQN